MVSLYLPHPTHVGKVIGPDSALRIVFLHGEISN